ADPIRRLAVLGGQGVAKALRLSRDEARRLDRLRDAIGSVDGAAGLGYRLGADEARDALLLRGALFAQPLPDGWQDGVARGVAAVFTVKAADLMPGLQGPALGARLKALEDRWIASGFALGRDDLLRITE
ncbi:CCA tRNA nucleotidyltransferase, partial [Escherichia coli]|nr:CCA tRNA nucleotidyltransferase [Escherichia coli]